MQNETFDRLSESLKDEKIGLQNLEKTLNEHKIKHAQKRNEINKKWLSIVEYFDNIDNDKSDCFLGTSKECFSSYSTKESFETTAKDSLEGERELPQPIENKPIDDNDQYLLDHMIKATEKVSKPDEASSDFEKSNKKTQEACSPPEIANSTPNLSNIKSPSTGICKQDNHSSSFERSASPSSANISSSINLPSETEKSPNYSYNLTTKDKMTDDVTNQLPKDKSLRIIQTTVPSKVSTNLSKESIKSISNKNSLETKTETVKNFIVKQSNDDNFSKVTNTTDILNRKSSKKSITKTNNPFNNNHYMNSAITREAYMSFDSITLSSNESNLMESNERVSNSNGPQTSQDASFLQATKTSTIINNSQGAEASTSQYLKPSLSYYRTKDLIETFEKDSSTIDNLSKNMPINENKQINLVSRNVLSDKSIGLLRISDSKTPPIHKDNLHNIAGRLKRISRSSPSLKVWSNSSLELEPHNDSVNFDTNKRFSTTRSLGRNDEMLPCSDKKSKSGSIRSRLFYSIKNKSQPLLRQKTSKSSMTKSTKNTKTLTKAKVMNMFKGLLKRKLSTEKIGDKESSLYEFSDTENGRLLVKTKQLSCNFLRKKNTYVLHTTYTIYIWIGSDATDKNQKDATNYSEHLSKSTTKDLKLRNTIKVEFQHSENQEFKNEFCDWPRTR